METQIIGTTAGLTTGNAPYIEQAQQQGTLYIRQPYELYNEDNQRAWAALYARMSERWRLYANPHFLRGIDNLCLSPDRIPSLEDVNRFLCPLTGFRAKAVSGYIPAFQFFSCLRDREFPTTITIRDAARLDYLPEPDIFHDIAGHVPMHTGPAFADALVRFGDCAHTAAAIVRDIKDEKEKLRRLSSIVRALARFFWFTIEFGLMESEEKGERKKKKEEAAPNLSLPPSSLLPSPGLKVYGSGLLSSYGEIEHSILSPDVQRYPLRLEWVINQTFEINRYQPLLFVVRDFTHLFELVDELEGWMRAGKLDNVAQGEPHASMADVTSFLESGA